ncbi:MAG: spermidine synthase [Candidatus Hydrogenedentes bacterium]|nr:spermidine synthase [Candidatus Hydrogenedentota bacterium]
MKGKQTINHRVVQVAALLFGSGLCALVYQVELFRELRLVFGSSTAESSCVLAIFMGGLGAGGAILGKRADASARPLRLYAQLELLVTVCAAVSPFLILIAQAVYLATGGSTILGLPVATIVRLLLSAVVLGAPTFLMGGTLPAAVRAVETVGDVHRRYLGWLYGLNTFGAVVGASLSTFYMLEVFGTHGTLWMACLLNACVGLTALLLSGKSAATTKPSKSKPSSQPEMDSTDGAATATLPASYVFFAAAVVGFAFFLMEIVWYRMLSPLLGGTTYTFGLILAVALLGIGAGGALYGFLAERRPARISGFAFSAAFEALFIAIPFALGDHVAVFAQTLLGLRVFGFSGYICGWSIVTAVVILPAAIVSGYQFPLLIALLGKGGERVGRQTGAAYAFNTLGAIAGALAGGFILLPWLTAPGLWRGTALLLSLLSGIAIILSAGYERGTVRLLLPQAAVLLTLYLALAPEGPTAAWRHSAIGAGRSRLELSDAAKYHNARNFYRRNIVWEAEGIESSVAIAIEDGLAFVLNGKIDGNICGEDVATQNLLGLLSATLHPEPKRSLVIGLGTGSSAGWLGRVDSMERVDVAELEPAILEVARRCALGNCRALDNPKVHVLLGDAREILLTTPDRYDLIASEPSNPYRAGIASLYTREFYQAVDKRLAPGGIFSQWLQGYEVDADTVCSVYATLASVFDCVETWQTTTTDMLFLCSREPIVYDGTRLRERIRQEPFKTALLESWWSIDLEGVLSHYVANPAFARKIADESLGLVNTDDRTSIEFRFTRTLDRKDLFEIAELRMAARECGLARPSTLKDDIDWELADELRCHIVRDMRYAAPDARDARDRRIHAYSRYLDNDFPGVLAAWKEQPRKPHYPVELAMVGGSLARLGNDAAIPLIEELEVYLPGNAWLLAARLHWRRGNMGEARKAFLEAMRRYREAPSGSPGAMAEALALAEEMVLDDAGAAAWLASVLKEPSPLSEREQNRCETALRIATKVGDSFAVPFIEVYEPYVPWNRDFLAYRTKVYGSIAGHPLKKKADADLAVFDRETPERFPAFAKE